MSAVDLSLPASAIFWDGGRESAMEIAEWIRHRGHHEDAVFHHHMVYSSGINTLQVDDGLGHSNVATPGAWILSLPGMIYLVLTEETYDASFSPESGKTMRWQEAAWRALEDSRG